MKLTAEGWKPVPGRATTERGHGELDRVGDSLAEVLASDEAVGRKTGRLATAPTVGRFGLAGATAHENAEVTGSSGQSGEAGHAEEAEHQLDRRCSCRTETQAEGDHQYA